MSDGLLDKLIKYVIESLELMEKDFTSLSRIRINEDELGEFTFEVLLGQKIQERPFAYEFYHQIRKRWDSDECPAWLKELVVQGEVNKFYQQIPHLQKCPDILIHRPDTLDEDYQVAAIEFKLASNLGNITEDLEKLVAFDHVLHYKLLIELLIATSERQLHQAFDRVDRLANKSTGERESTIVVLGFETTERKCSWHTIQYRVNM